MKKKLSLFFYECKKNPLLLIGLVSVLFIAFITIFGPNFCSHDPNKTIYANKLIAPCREFPLGTDMNGRCMLCRIVHGAHISIGVALAVVGISLVIGVSVGMIAGFAGGVVDAILMRVVEVLLSFPGTIFALAVLGTMGNGILNQIVALSFVRWAHYARLTRGETLQVMNADYIESAQAMGNSKKRIIFSYILPNIIGKVLVIATLSIGPVILAGASLSYLGLGAQIPSPEWGLMISNGKDYIWNAPWITLAPGMAAVLTVLAFNLLGEGINDAIDPRLKEKVME